MKEINKNKLKFVVTVCVIVSLTSLALLVGFAVRGGSSGTPHLLPFQGVATDKDGNLISTGNLTVRIYDAPTGGSLVYDSGDAYVGAIQNGVFDVLLGSVVPLNLDNTKKYYMEVDINGEEVVGDAVAGRSEFYPGGGSHTHTHDASDITGGTLVVDGLNVDSGTLYVDDVNDTVGIGTTSPVGALDVLTTFTAEQRDQEQSSGTHVTQQPNAWQSFTAGKTGVLTKIELWLEGTYDGELYIREGEGESGTIISSTHVHVNPGPWQVADINDCNVTAGQQYTIHLTGAPVPWRDDPGNPYPGGRAMWHPEADYTFRTYVLAEQTEHFVVTNDGKVGIGTASPAYKLDVEGYAQAYGYYTGDIIFQEDGVKLWRMFEEEDGLYLENLKTGKAYSFVLQEVETETTSSLVESDRLVESNDSHPKPFGVHVNITQGIAGLVIALGVLLGLALYRAKNSKEETDIQQSKLSQWLEN